MPILIKSRFHLTLSRQKTFPLCSAPTPKPSSPPRRCLVLPIVMVTSSGKAGRICLTACCSCIVPSYCPVRWLRCRTLWTPAGGCRWCEKRCPWSSEYGNLSLCFWCETCRMVRRSNACCILLVPRCQSSGHFLISGILHRRFCRRLWQTSWWDKLSELLRFKVCFESHYLYQHGLRRRTLMDISQKDLKGITSISNEPWYARDI